MSRLDLFVVRGYGCVSPRAAMAGTITNLAARTCLSSVQNKPVPHAFAIDYYLIATVVRIGGTT